MEHSENNVITQFGMLENEIRPGVLQPSVQHTFAMQEWQRQKLRPLRVLRFVSAVWHFCSSSVC